MHGEVESHGSMGLYQNPVRVKYYHGTKDLVLISTLVGGGRDKGWEFRES